MWFLCILDYMFSFFKPSLHMVVHDKSFHADDVMACAIMHEYAQRIGKRLIITRTRDEAQIARADVVADVGNSYDPATWRFDHHQPEGAGVRTNGIPYASAGLVWKHVGLELCDGDTRMHEAIDYGVMQSLDSADNGFCTITLKEGYPAPYFYGDALMSFRPAYNEQADMDARFAQAVAYARTALVRELASARGASEANEKIFATYQSQKGNEILIIDQPFSREDINRAFAVHTMPEPLLVVFPTGDEITGEITGWKLLTIRKGGDIFEPRLSLPTAWSGLRDEELQQVTGVADAVFSHRGNFMAVTKTKEGALQLAKLALVK